ncbi:hypothetical protein F240042I4_09070 [Eisenbergiella tayi]
MVHSQGDYGLSFGSIGSGYYFSFRLYLVRERFEKYPDGRRKLHGKEQSSPVNGTWDIVRYGI